MDIKSDEIQKMIDFSNLLDKNAIHRYRLIKPILETQFGQPEFDLVRNEIGRCYLLGAYQACITLTNHLLERYLKIILITKESGFTTLKELEGLEEIFKDANTKYLGMDLSETLAKFKSSNLITKDEWKRLDKFREQIRNGFGHSDPRKIFGDAKGKFVQGNLIDGSVSEVKELEFAKIPMLQGIATSYFAESNALHYYVEIENLIRKTINHIQPEEFKIKHKLISIVPKSSSEDSNETL